MLDCCHSKVYLVLQALASYTLLLFTNVRNTRSYGIFVSKSVDIVDKSLQYAFQSSKTTQWTQNESREGNFDTPFARRYEPRSRWVTCLVCISLCLNNLAIIRSWNTNIKVLIPFHLKKNIDIKSCEQSNRGHNQFHKYIIIHENRKGVHLPVVQSKTGK